MITKFPYSLIGVSLLASAATQNVFSADKPHCPEHPNLLFIWTDQQIDNSLAVYGNTVFKVPNLNKLAEESIVFANSYVVQPVSTPSRGSVLTGMYPHMHGAIQNNTPINADAKTLPELINNDMYATGYFGKWHLGDEIFEQHGFEEFDSVEDLYYEYYSADKDKNARSGYHKFLVENGLEPDDRKNNVFTRNYTASLSYEYSKPKFLEYKAKDFLTRHQNQPFILYVNYLEPHTPFNGPFNELHDMDSLELSQAVDCMLTDNDPVRYHARVRNNVAKEQYRKLYRNYAGLCHAVDLSIGKILKHLDSLGLRNNTIVVFTSDHGEMMGAHGLNNKSVMYEQALRVPLMFRIPWINMNKQRIVTPNVTNIDLVPTLLELMNCQADMSHLQGRSLMEMFNGDRRTNDDGYIYMMWNPNEDDKKSNPVDGYSKEQIAYYTDASFRTVISPDGWKLTLSDRDKNQLFNLNSDPHECNNLYYSGKYSNEIKKLSAKIRRWQKEINDKIKLNN